jgi:hypothetical protein
VLIWLTSIPTLGSAPWWLRRFAPSGEEGLNGKASAICGRLKFASGRSSSSFSLNGGRASTSTEGKSHQPGQPAFLLLHCVYAGWRSAGSHCHGAPRHGRIGGAAGKEVGDGDGLWKNWGFSDIRRAHHWVFELLHEFNQQNRFHLIMISPGLYSALPFQFASCRGCRALPDFEGF